MRKMWLNLCIMAVLMSGVALGAEFQPMGALGIGGAGVARITNGYAPYWNPAGLAFNEMTVHVPLNVSVGLRVSEGLADNVDRLSKFTEDDSVFDNIKSLSGGTALEQANAVGDVVNLITIFNEIDVQKGTVSLNGSAALALQVNHFGTGVFATLEGYARPDADLKNVLPQASEVTDAPPISRTEFATAAAGSAGASDYFNSAQISEINTALTGAGFTQADATNIINAVGSRLAQGDVTINGATLPAIDSAAVTRTITDVIAPAFADGSGASTIDQNRTAVFIKSLAYTEIPLSYGYPIDMGRFGKLGVGGSLKVVRGRVYQSSVQLIENGEGVESEDILDNFTKNYEDTTRVTFDLGAFWKYNDWLNVGLVAKNLTSPSFKSPENKDQHGNLVTTDAKGNPLTKENIKLKPQVRMGICLEPLSWLSLAADLDITENESVLTGIDYKSRNLGGGLEIHPFTWFKLRGGMYTNLANPDTGPVATAGLTFGTRWVNLEIDGAYGLEKAKFDDKSYPKEARAQAALNIQF